ERRRHVRDAGRRDDDVERAGRGVHAQPDLGGGRLRGAGGVGQIVFGLVGGRDRAGVDGDLGDRGSGQQREQQQQQGGSFHRGELRGGLKAQSIRRRGSRP